MNSNQTLSGAHLRTYNTIFQEHLTKDQILAKAREFYANAQLPPRIADPQKAEATVETK